MGPKEDDSLQGFLGFKWQISRITAVQTLLLTISVISVVESCTVLSAYEVLTVQWTFYFLHHLRTKTANILYLFNQWKPGLTVMDISDWSRSKLEHTNAFIVSIKQEKRYKTPNLNNWQFFGALWWCWYWWWWKNNLHFKADCVMSPGWSSKIEVRDRDDSNQYGNFQPPWIMFYFNF